MSDFGCSISDLIDYIIRIGDWIICDNILKLNKSEIEISKSEIKKAAPCGNGFHNQTKHYYEILLH
jgi:hypothetical protein